MNYRLFRILVPIMLVFLTHTAFSQDTSSPTPAPSKTATPTASTEEAAGNATSIPRELPRSYTQEDLSVLVGNVQRPNGIVYFDGNLYTACNGDWTLYQVDSATGSTITFVFGVQNAHQLSVEPSATGFNLWIPDFDTNRFLRVDEQQGTPVEIASENLDGPWGIAQLNETGFLITNVRSNNLVLADREGAVRVLAEGFRSPAGIVLDGDYGYIVNNGSARRAIEWFNLASLPLEDAEAVESDTIASTLVSGLQNVSNIVLAEDGYLYFTYALGTRGVVGRVDPDACRDAECTNEQVEIVLFTDLPAPLAGLTITPDFRLFVHTIFRPEIYWLHLYG